jgi:hypothetical protein
VVLGSATAFGDWFGSSKALVGRSRGQKRGKGCPGLKTCWAPPWFHAPPPCFWITVALTVDLSPTLLMVAVWTGGWVGGRAGGCAVGWVGGWRGSGPARAPRLGARLARAAVRDWGAPPHPPARRAPQTRRRRSLPATSADRLRATLRNEARRRGASALDARAARTGERGRRGAAGDGRVEFVHVAGVVPGGAGDGEEGGAVWGRGSGSVQGAAELRLRLRGSAAAALGRRAAFLAASTNTEARAPAPADGVEAVTRNAKPGK